MRKTINNRGVTLIELVITLAIITIISGVVIMSIGSNDRRVLNNTALALQADLQYTQRRAMQEGQPVGVQFSVAENVYRIRSGNIPVTEEIRTMPEGVRLRSVSGTGYNLMFHPRGTPSAATTIVLSKGLYTQEITVIPSGGRVRVYEPIRDTRYQ